jgi:hypothetical protein
MMILAFANPDLPRTNETLLCRCERTYRVLSTRRGEGHGTAELMPLQDTAAVPAHAEISHCPTCETLAASGTIAGHEAAIVPVLIRPPPTRKRLHSIIDQALDRLKGGPETSAWVAEIQKELRL